MPRWNRPPTLTGHPGARPGRSRLLSYSRTVSFMSAALSVPLPSPAPLSLGPINKRTRKAFRQILALCCWSGFVCPHPSACLSSRRCRVTAVLLHHFCSKLVAGTVPLRGFTSLPLPEVFNFNLKVSVKSFRESVLKHGFGIAAEDRTFLRQSSNSEQSPRPPGSTEAHPGAEQACRASLSLLRVFGG